MFKVPRIKRKPLIADFTETKFPSFILFFTCARTHRFSKERSSVFLRSCQRKFRDSLSTINTFLF